MTKQLITLAVLCMAIPAFAIGPISGGSSGGGTTLTDSASLSTALSNETGTGLAVFATSPTLVTPILGTPTSGTVTNLTGTASININGTVGQATPLAGSFTTLSNTGAATNSAAGATSAPSLKLSGVPFAGSGTTSFPLLYINDADAIASTTLNTAGTYLGINIDGTQDGINVLKDGASVFRLTSAGDVTIGNGYTTENYFYFRNKGGFYGIADGVFRLTNLAGTGFGRLQFGGTSNSYAGFGFDAVNGFTLQSAAGTATWNDASTAISGTVANRYLFGIAAPTLTATNATVTDTVASTVYIGGAPTASTNTTITTAWALNVAAGNVNVGGSMVVATQTPASAAAAGVAGTITWDASFIYICTATNTWKRVAIATW